MAISVQNRVEAGTTSSSTSSFNLSALNISAGDSICLFIRLNNTSSQVPTISDTMGNTYVQKLVETESTTKVYVYWVESISGSNSSNVINISWSSGVTYTDHIAVQVRGGASGCTWGDVTYAVIGGSSVAPKIATTCADSLILAFTCVDSTSDTISFPAGNFTTNAFGQTPSGGNFCNNSYNIYSSIQQNPSLTVTSTISASATGFGVLVFLKQAPASGWFLRQKVSSFTYPAVGSTQTLTFPNACVSGSVIAVQYTDNGSGTFTGISDSASQTYSSAHAKVGAGYGTLYGFYCLNSSTTALGVTTNYSANTQYSSFQITEWEYIGSGTASFDSGASNTGSGTAMSVAVNVTNSGELGIGFEIVDAGGSFTFNEGFYSVDPNNPGPNGDASMCFSLSNSPSSVTIENTLTPTGSWGMIGATFTTGSMPSSTLRELLLLGVGS